MGCSSRGEGLGDKWLDAGGSAQWQEGELVF